MPAYNYAHKRKLKNLLIDPQMQKQYTYLMIVLIMVAALVISLIVHITIREALTGPYKIGVISPYEVMSRINYQLIVRITITMILTIIAASFCGIAFLHRIAGPIYRFRVTLKKMAKGEIIPNIKLRKGDFYHDVADQINNVLELLRKKRAYSDEVEKEIEGIAKSGNIEELRNKLPEIQKKLKAI